MPDAVDQQSWLQRSPSWRAKAENLCAGAKPEAKGAVLCAVTKPGSGRSRARSPGVTLESVLMSYPPILQHAFRTCFLLASLWAAAALPLWLMSYSGVITLDSAYGEMNWHAHEMVFGYAALVICGFLFTAIPNWTGRLPVSGWPLALLVLTWLAGRLAMLQATHLGLATAAVIDLAFLAAMIAVAGREIVAGKNWRNLRVLVIVTWLLLANVAFHAAAISGAAADLSLRGSIGALIALITLVGGRLAPSFTRNWLVKQGATALPAPFGKLDAAGIGCAVVGLLLWIVAPDGVATSAVAALAAILLIGRLLRWRGWATRREPLLLILHVGYAFVPLGFLLLAVSAVRPDLVPISAVVHAWTAGAIGTMTLAVMTRASLGHTGRALTATPATTAIYIAIVLAALLRVSAAFALEWRIALIDVAGAAWTAAFLLFAASYGPLLCTARKAKVA